MQNLSRVRKCCMSAACWVSSVGATRRLIKRQSTDCACILQASNSRYFVSTQHGAGCCWLVSVLLGRQACERLSSMLLLHMYPAMHSVCAYLCEYAHSF